MTIIKQAETDDEFEQYYSLRYRLLRQPWGEPAGSEKDDIEDECRHIIAIEDDKVIGVGRLQFNSDTEAQIRYMAVEEEHEGRSIGRQIVAALEQQAIDAEVSEIVLDARKTATGFYKKLGYTRGETTYLLFDSIQHYRMNKRLR